MFADLPNELLIEILQFCDGDDVINFAEAVSLKKADIWDVIDNSRLWTYVVISPDPEEKFINEKFIRYLGKYTKHLKIEWQKTSSDRYISKSFFPKSLTRLKLFTDEWLMVQNPSASQNQAYLPLISDLSDLEISDLLDLDISDLSVF